MSERLAIFAEGLFTGHHGKTAHGVIRYGNRDVVAVVDSANAGRTAAEVEPFCLRDVPIVATLREAIDLGAGTLLVGVAPTGGKLDPSWRAVLREAIDAGLHLEAGLHTQPGALARQHPPVDELQPGEGPVGEQEMAVEVDPVEQRRDLRGGGDAELGLDHAAEHRT